MFFCAMHLHGVFVTLEVLPEVSIPMGAPHHHRV